MADVKVKGLSDLNKLLQQLPVNVEKNVLRGALRDAAKTIEAEVKARVPVDTGRLRDSVRVSVRVRRGRVTASVYAGGQDTRKRIVNNASGRVKVKYDNAYYARFVEFGTAAHYIKAVTAKALILRSNKRASSGFARRWTSWVVEGVQHPGAKPRPFMRPALDAKAQEAVVSAAKYIRNRLANKNGLTQASEVEIEPQ